MFNITKLLQGFKSNFNLKDEENETGQRVKNEPRSGDETLKYLS